MIEPQKWASTLGSLSDTVTLPDEDLQFASFKKLFPALTQVPLSEGGVAPQRTDFNTLFKLLGDNIFYIQQGGVFSYSENADYEKGAFVKYNDELFLCIQDNSSFNIHAPTDAEYWKKIALNSDLVNYIPLVGGNVTGNLTVKNKNVDAIEEQGEGYIRYSTGLQICWGVLQKWSLTWADHEFDCNLPKPFKDTNYTVQTTARGTGSDFMHTEIDLTNNSYFHCSCIPLQTYSDGTIKALWDEYSNPWNGLYLAIGYWK